MFEPIILAMKPIDGNFAENALKWGVAGLNIEACRVGVENIPETKRGYAKNTAFCSGVLPPEHSGRWPGNVVLDEEAAVMVDEQSGESSSRLAVRGIAGRVSQRATWKQSETGIPRGHDDCGGASRFFYTSKASPAEREEFNSHPTVKPLSLLRWLLKLISAPVPGITLDPFAGSGSTLVACQSLGLPYIGIEKESKYVAIARERLNRKRLPLFEPEQAEPGAHKLQAQASLFDSADHEDEPDY